MQHTSGGVSFRCPTFQFGFRLLTASSSSFLLAVALRFLGVALLRLLVLLERLLVALPLLLVVVVFFLEAFLAVEAFLALNGRDLFCSHTQTAHAHR